MKRFAFASSVFVLFAFSVVSVLAQAKPAQAPATKAVAPAPASTAPAAAAKFIKPLKGTADVEFMEVSAKKIGDDIVTVLRIKNLSNAPVSLLKVDEYWYNKAQKLVTGDSAAYRKPFMPGEIIELTIKAPYKSDISVSQYQFSHAGGQVNPKRVKKVS
ncbi:MAG: hypothetical protein ACJ731_14490 [Vicinamibacterales bacterium]